MNKKLDLFEHFKTGILVVLFLITILLLYLCIFNSGSELSFASIVSAEADEKAELNVYDYLVPAYTVQSEGNGKFNITYRNQKKIFDTASECTKSLLASSNISITKIGSDEYEKTCKENKSIVLVFDFDYPFDEYCSDLIGRTLQKPDDFKGFSSIMFSDKIKSDLYFRDNNENCFKISVAENYYSTEALGQVISFDVGEIGYSYLFLLKYQSAGLDETINFENAAEKVFGETFDFVRKITDTVGNETYMYGYGQKRLSIYADGGLEFKEDIKGSGKTDFYEDLGKALIFSRDKLDIDYSQLRLVTVEKQLVDGTELYHFEFDAASHQIICEVKNSQISYYYISESQGV